MTLPTGTISMSQVNVELLKASTALIALGDSDVRTLAGVPTGAISMDNLRGKTNQFSFTISANQTNANLRTLAVSAGWNQTTPVVATIASGVYISSSAVGTPALTVNGSFPNGVTLVNNGVIAGMGGAGGNGGNANYNGGFSATNGVAGSAGGNALTASVAVTIQNLGTIAGGGGGGGGGGGCATSYSPPNNFPIVSGGGGGGGGRSSLTNSAAGGGGSATSILGGDHKAPGSAGGAGTNSAAGGGGAGGVKYAGADYAAGGNGGNGGSWGSGGSTGGAGYGTNSVVGSGGGGGGAGSAISGNSFITWTATGTRLGGIA